MPRIWSPSDIKTLESLLDALNDVSGYEENGKVPVRGEISAEVLRAVCRVVKYQWEA